MGNVPDSISHRKDNEPLLSEEKGNGVVNDPAREREPLSEAEREWRRNPKGGFTEKFKGM